MRLHHIAYSQCVNVGGETTRKAAGNALAAEFGNGVGVHGVYVVGFVEGERGVVEIALAEADFVGCFGGGYYYLSNAEFTGGFDDVVGGGYVAAVAFVVLLLYVNTGSWGIGDWEAGVKVDGRRTGTSMFRAYAAKWMTASGGLALLGPS
jgi:hypothetical protein